MNQVWQIAPTAVTSTERLVLLNLASHGNDGGRNAYPSVQRMARQTSLTPRAVQKALRRLAEKGLLEAVGRASRGTVRYALVLGRLADCEPRSQSAVGNREPGSQSKKGHREPRSQSAARDREPGSPVSEPRSPLREPRSQICEPRSPDPSFDPSLETSLERTPPPAAAPRRLTTPGGNGAGADRDRFEAFWKIYPKRVGKDAAWKAWQKRKLNAELVAQILAALAWQRQQDNWLVDGGRFIPHPATWINAGRWQDEPNTTPRLNAKTIAIGRATEEFLK
jgi:Helix-turn-helix domain